MAPGDARTIPPEDLVRKASILPLPQVDVTALTEIEALNKELDEVLLEAERLSLRYATQLESLGNNSPARTEEDVAHATIILRKLGLEGRPVGTFVLIRDYVESVKYE